MRRSNLVILAAAVVVLGVFILVVERHQPTSDQRRERADRLFPELDADDVEKIELTTGAGDIRLARDGDDWRLTDPSAYPADPAAVLGLLEAISGLDADRVLRGDEVEAAGYGLDDPEFELALTDADGRRWALTVGATAPLGSKRAVRRGEADEVVLCANAFVSRLDLPIDDWRSREVVSVAESELAAIDISTGGDRIRAERVGRRWQLVEPLADLADREQIGQLISEFNGLRVSEFLSAGAATLGADDPEFRVRLERADGSDPVVLELAPAEDGATTVVCRRDGVDLFRVPDTLGLRLGKAPVLWRSKLVWPFNAWDVSSVAFSGLGKAIDLDRVEGMWQLSDGSPGDGAEVRRRLSRLAELGAAAHDLVLPPTEVLGSVVLVIDGEEGPTELRFTFYGAMEDGGHAAVSVSERDNVMAVDATAAAAIIGDLETLRTAADVGAGR